MGKAAIGHVLNSAVHAPAFRDVPFDADVTGELNVVPEIHGAITILAQNGGASPGFQKYRKCALGQFKHGTQRGDKTVGIVAANPAGGSVQVYPQVPVRVKIPALRKFHPNEPLALVETRCRAIQGKSCAHAGLKILRAAAARD